MQALQKAIDGCLTRNTRAGRGPAGRLSHCCSWAAYRQRRGRGSRVAAQGQSPALTRARREQHASCGAERAPAPRYARAAFVWVAGATLLGAW